MNYRIIVLVFLLAVGNVVNAQEDKLQNLYETGKFERCIRLSARKIKHNKDKLNAYLYQALSYYEISKIEDQQDVKKPVLKSIVALSRMYSKSFFKAHETQAWIVAQNAEQKAKEYYRSLKYSNSANIYRYLVRIYPENSRYLYVLAELQFRNNETYEGVKSLERITDNFERKHIKKEKLTSSDAQLMADIIRIYYDIEQYDLVQEMIAFDKKIFKGYPDLTSLNQQYSLLLIQKYAEDQKCDIPHLSKMMMSYKLDFGETDEFIVIEKEIEQKYWEIHMLNIVNRYRTLGFDNGIISYRPVPPVFWSDKLAKSANRHAKDMSRNKFLGHIGTNGSRTKDRIVSAGYNSYRAAENIANGFDNVENVMNAWMLNPKFRKNIMDPYFRDFGAAWDGESWVQNFGSKK